LLLKEDQSLQPKSEDNIKCLQKYYNWLSNRILWKELHPHDMKCMSDEAYYSLSWYSNEPKMLPTNQFLGAIASVLIQNVNPVEAGLVPD
jgi:hypothetical protein